MSLDRTFIAGSQGWIKLLMGPMPKTFGRGLSHSGRQGHWQSCYLTRRDLRILIGLLTGHPDLNRHLTLIKVRSDSNCPLCQEEEETVLHLLGRCNALSLTRLNHLGSHRIIRMDYNDLSNTRWPLLLKLAKSSGRFW